MIPASWAWSLALEEQFYLIWPVTLRWLLLRRSRRQVAARLMLLALLVEIARAVIGKHLFTLDNSVRGDELLFGCCLALVPWEPSRWLTVLAAAVFGWVTSGPQLAAAYGITLAAFACTVLLAAVISDPKTAALVTVRPLRYLGRISYSLYLWNGIFTAAWFEAHDADYPHGWSALALGVASVGLAVASTHLLEEPLRRRLRQPRTRHAVTDAAPALHRPSADPVG